MEADMEAFMKKLRQDKEFAARERYSGVWDYGEYKDPDEDKARREREACASEQKYLRFYGGRNSY